MIDGTYKISIDALFGKKEGTVVLHTKGNVVTADIDAPVIGEQHVEGVANGDSFAAKGSGEVLLVGEIEYDLHGKVTGNDLHIDIKSNKGEFELDGVRVQNDSQVKPAVLNPAQSSK